MRKIVLLGKHEIIDNGLSTEDEKDKKQRSYIHYLLDSPELVSVKCNCVSWIFENLSFNSLIEYMAGVGCSSVILRDRYSPEKHKTLELSKECVDHLRKNGFDSDEGDVTKTISEIVDGYEFKIADYPFGTIITNMRGEWKNFLDLFKGDVTKYVSWTDSSGSYPIKIHGGRYALEMNLNGVVFETWEDYFKAYSKFIFEKTGFAITRVARRKLGNKFGSSFIMSEKMSEYRDPEFKIFDSEMYGASIEIDGVVQGQSNKKESGSSLW